MSKHRERFEKLFGPQSSDRPGLPYSLRQQVYGRMFNVFHSEQNPQRVLRHFRHVFHPDRPDSIFSKTERHQVFITIDHIFRGKKL